MKSSKSSSKKNTNTFSGLRFRPTQDVPLIWQKDTGDCGLACLAMIANHYGRHTTLGELKLKSGSIARGATLGYLIELSADLGLMARPVRLDVDEMPSLKLPCILHWDMNHFVVLIKLKKNRIYLLDPARGERIVTFNELGSSFTGIALELTKGGSFKKKDAPPSLSLKSFIGSISGFKKYAAILTALAVALEACSLLVPQFTQITVDQVLADEDRDLLVVIGSAFVFTCLIQVVLSTARSWALMWLNSQLSVAWVTNVFRHLLKLPQNYFSDRSIGDIYSRFSSLSSIQQVLVGGLMSGILDGLTSIVTLAVMMAYSFKLTALVATSLLVYTAFKVIYLSSYKESNFNQISMAAKQQSMFIESVRGIQSLRVNNAHSRQASRYLNSTIDMVNSQIRVQRFQVFFDAVSHLIFGLQRVLSLWVAAWYGLKGEFSAGMLMAFLAYADQFLSRSSALVDFIIQIKLVGLQSERLADIVLSREEAHLTSTYIGELYDSSIDFSSVSFRYSSQEKMLLRNCSVKFESGKSTAIVGPSGVGKSTLINLILGIHNPHTGSISVGGVSTQRLGKTNLRKLVAAVQQDDHLFSGTLAENISMFDPDADYAKITYAARMAQIDADILAMPMGYGTPVGAIGSTLSGGQQQRIFLARALYKDPKILLLDEATSHLDIELERQISSSISSMAITRIIVSHRPESISHVDHIYVMTEGSLLKLER